MISLASGASIHAVVYLVDTARTGLDNGVAGSEMNVGSTTT